MSAAKITIHGAWAALEGVAAADSELHAALSVLDPRRFFKRAFRERRWDGRVRFHSGCRFPAGLVGILADRLRGRGIEVSARSAGGGKIEMPVDPECLRGIRLWPHQIEAVQVMLARPRGYLEEPTGSGKTAVIAAAARIFWEEKGWRSLVLTSRAGIAVQTVDALRGFYGDEIDVGIAGDGRREDGVVTVSNAQTLMRFRPRTSQRGKRGKQQHTSGDPHLRELVESADVLFVDEAHHASSETWYEIAMACPAVRRYGLSGTPAKDDEIADRRLIATTGSCIHRTAATDLIDVGLAAKPKIAMVMAECASGPSLARDVGYAEAYQRGVVGSVPHNAAVVRAVSWLVDRGRRVLVLCRKREHFVRLEQGIRGSGVRLASVWGATEMSTRLEAKRAFSAGEVDAVLATTVWDEGEDVRGIDAIVLAEGVKVETSAVQRIGRGMRRDSADVWVVDFVPLSHRRLAQHAMQRCQAYENRGYEVVVVDRWPTAGAETPHDLLPFERWDDAARDRRSAAS